MQDHAETIVGQQHMKPVIVCALRRCPAKFAAMVFGNPKTAALGRRGADRDHTDTPEPVPGLHATAGGPPDENDQSGIQNENLTKPTLLDRRSRSKELTIPAAVLEIRKEAAPVSVPTR